MGGRVDVRMGGWVDGWMVGWMSERVVDEGMEG